jgi:membrane protein required for colicin V production
MLFIDYVIIFIIVISSLLGIFRGFIKELLAIISWVLAFYFSSILSDSVSKFIPFDFDDSLKYFIAYLLIFVFVLIVASILIKLLNKFVKTVGLTLTNVLMGSIFGLIRGVLIAFLLILVAENFRFIDKETLSKSLLVPMIKEYVEKTLPYLPEEWLTHVEYDNILT